MKNLKKISIFALVLVLALGTLASCGGSGSSDDSSASDEDKTIKVAATASPHAEVLEVIKDNLAEEGWDLQIEVFDDYVQPNVATTDGDVDANYFQHINYLTDYNEENGTDLVAVGDVHYEPFGIYKGTKDSLDALESGDKVGVPNDASNEKRALDLLEANGLITLKEGLGSEATVTDIVDNPKGLEIVELEAASIPASLPDLAIGLINFNYAQGAGKTADDAIVYESEDSDAIDGYVNVIVVNEANKDSEKTKALVAAIQSDEVKQFIEEKYNGLVKTRF